MGAAKVVYSGAMGKQIPMGFNPGPGATLVGQSIYSQSTTKNHALGERLQIGNRVFYYASAGEALVAGMLCESAAFGGSSATIQTNLTVPTVTDGSNAAGQNKVTVTLATDAAVVGLYNDGYLSVYDGTAATGMGQTYRIKTSAVATAGGALKLTLYDDLVILLTAGTAKVNLITNEYKAIKTSAANPVGFPVGVPLIVVASGSYGWVQTWGPVCGLLGGTAPTNETGLQRSTSTAGEFECMVTGAGYLPNPIIGFLMHIAIADTKYGMVFLQISV